MHQRRFGWMFALLFVVLTVGFGAFAYTVGMHHGLAQGGAFAAGVEPGSRIVMWGPGPWHGGFGFVFPLVFFFLVFGLMRRAMWGGPWSRLGACSFGTGVPPAFAEWHRRAHEQSHGAPAEGHGRGPAAPPAGSSADNRA